MQRHHQSRYGPERDDRSRDPEDRSYERDTRGRYESSERRGAGYGEEWPPPYRSDSGDNPQRFRDSWSERQTGPYRSSLTGRPLSEDDYRQESRHYRSQPYTGFAGRVSEYGFEDPSWAAPDAGRQGGVASMPGGGVEENYRGKGPRHYARSDQRIKEDICDDLSDDRLCDARNIDIDVTEGKVTLSGSVPARHMKHRAEDIADDARGVKDVDNRIRVDRHESGERHTSSESQRHTASEGERYTVSEDGGLLTKANSRSSTSKKKAK